MKVKCRTIMSSVTHEKLDEDSPWLKIGSEYVVLAITVGPRQGISIYIQTEHHNEPAFVNVNGFEFLSQIIPSSWVTKISEIYDCKIITMLPASWNYDGFFEDMEEQDPKAIQLFNKEIEKIYREEETI